MLKKYKQKLNMVSNLNFTENNDKGSLEILTKKTKKAIKPKVNLIDSFKFFFLNLLMIWINQMNQFCNRTLKKNFTNSISHEDKKTRKTKNFINTNKLDKNSLRIEQLGVESNFNGF